MTCRHGYPLEMCAVCHAEAEINKFISNKMSKYDPNIAKYFDNVTGHKILWVDDIIRKGGFDA